MIFCSSHYVRSKWIFYNSHCWLDGFFFQGGEDKLNINTNLDRKSDIGGCHITIIQSNPREWKLIPHKTCALFFIVILFVTAYNGKKDDLHFMNE